ncbi:MAG TPA: hypothetical protein VIM87_16315 [Chitinophaga sp.]|uniref:hypothetical protein n=1 Tax=Chitinophaga sp. TaxID=1869181 RepID=UPI002F93DB26
MEVTQNQLAQLIAFKQRDKFSAAAWNERGLNPSGDELCQALTNQFNECADRLIAGINNGATNRQLKRMLRSALYAFHKPDYDTEERGFICDLFDELATIVNVDIKHYLNSWLYGSVLATIVKVARFLRPEKVIDTISQSCSSCNQALDITILQKEEGIPDGFWLIVKCSNCNEFNLLSPGPNIRSMRYGNYQCVETLSKDEFSYEQAQVRMEQIKFFRK